MGTPTKGKSVKIKLPGTPTAMVGEATTEDVTTKIYQITDTAKQVLEFDGTISVHKYSEDDEAEALTNTTSIIMTAHGLVSGDLIINASRSDAKRIVTYVSDNEVTVAAVTDQASGDVIEKYPTEAAADYTLNRLEGKVTYAAADTRVIYISGNYLPLAEMAAGKEFTLTLSGNNEDTTVFGKNFICRTQTLKDVTMSISGFYLTDDLKDYIDDDEIVIVELYINRDSTWHAKLWSRMSSEEISGGVDGVLEEAIELEGTNDEDGNTIVFA